MRVRLKGINSITKKLADGTTRTYWYAWKGGPPLRGQLGSPEFIASYNEAAARKVTPPIGKLLSLLQGYQVSEDFTGLAATTRRSYVALIVRIAKAFADFQLEANPSQHQVMRQIDNGSPVQLVRNDIEIVSRIMPEQGQLERLGSIRNCQRSAGSRGVLMIAD